MVTSFPPSVEVFLAFQETLPGSYKYLVVGGGGLDERKGDERRRGKNKRQLGAHMGPEQKQTLPLALWLHSWMSVPSLQSFQCREEFQYIVLEKPLPEPFLSTAELACAF